MTAPLPTTREELGRWLVGKVVRKATVSRYGDLDLTVAPHQMSSRAQNVTLSISAQGDGRVWLKRGSEPSNDEDDQI